MPIGFYAAFFNLSEQDRFELYILAEDDEYLKKIVQESADMWRKTLRPMYQTHFQCRTAFLTRSVLIAAKYGVSHGCGGSVASAFALFVCDRVEELVFKLDGEEENAQRT